MCDFCSEGNITDSGFFRPTPEYDDYIYHDKDGWHLNVYYECGDYASMPIKYCPLCGRKLVEDESAN